jgi:membrane protein
MTPPPSLSQFRRFSWPQVRNLFRFATRRLKEEHLPEVAGSLTFTTVLALVPIVTIAFAVFTIFPVFTTFRASLEAYFIQNLMPKAIANNILGYLNQFAAKSKGLSAIGGIFLFLTAAMTLSMIDRVFNQIWRVKDVRPLPQRILVYWAIVTLGPLLIGMSISVTSFLFTATNGAMMQRSGIGPVIYTLVSVLLTTGAFTLLYIAIPNRMVDWRDAIWGGFFAGIAFEIAKRLFAVYVTKFPTYTVIYGAVAAIPIFLIWIYLFWMITLSGALLAAALPVVKYERWWHVPTPGSEFVDAMAILRVLQDARISHASAAVDARTIRALTRLGFDESERLLTKMLDAGWVGCIKAETPVHRRLGRHRLEGLDRWVLLVNPEQLKVADVYRMFVFNAAHNLELARQVESAVEQGLSQNLAGYFSGLQSNPA